MDILYVLIVVFGLCIFETIASIDNAIINADILSTMKAWARRWFLLWGLLIAVFVVRGILPWLIIWISAPSLGPIGALTATFSGDKTASAAIEASAPYLLIGGSIFLILLFLHWILVEEKNCIVPGERFLVKFEPWFNVVSAIILLIIVTFAINKDPFIAVAALIGFTVYQGMMGIRIFADKKTIELERQKDTDETSENNPKKTRHSDISKLMLLEVIDASFSVDGVVGAFAFTHAVPLILIGNGLGALIVRELTIRNIENIRKFKYLKNGAMYSILALGIIMCIEAFGIHLPVWVPPIITIIIVGIFLILSILQSKNRE